MITDWSKKGTGFVIMRKHCNCVNDINDQSILNCCKEGWRLAFCKSRHLDIFGDKCLNDKCLKSKVV